MFAIPDVAITPTQMHDASYRWTEIRPGGEPLQTRSLFTQSTPFNVCKSSELDVFPSVDTTHTTQPNATYMHETSAFVSEIGQPADSALKAKAENVSEERATLMAAKFMGNNASKELLARLQILDQRMLELAPVVTHFQISALESAADELEKLKLRRNERAAKFGL